jgi:hypothetical protein
MTKHNGRTLSLDRVNIPELDLGKKLWKLRKHVRDGYKHFCQKRGLREGWGELPVTRREND